MRSALYRLGAAAVDGPLDNTGVAHLTMAQISVKVDMGHKTYLCRVRPKACTV